MGGSDLLLFEATHFAPVTTATRPMVSERAREQRAKMNRSRSRTMLVNDDADIGP